ncbi:Predicted transcriptional regulator, ArsR family [Ferrimonas sediminum]|uniref:Predicted transcriptional regulator, ArsR family n=1 Tax=Ferrimonas sediminum TaxID=718193 RepID=A0A1G9AFS5_9GAMM|nr:metalloregulator ArsR/SmtB family transcription factor [Ferrimonas sediminum]SDK26118.1 Predicted transcriptional regulator, ArsR family [Ferrimonas sediminum]
MSSSQQQLLSLLKRLGPSAIAPLAGALSMTTMGVRQHLDKLERQGLIRHFDKQQGKGRPTRHWHLTKKGHQSFGDRHNDIAIQLITGLIELRGDTAMTELLRHRLDRQLQLYRQQLGEADALPQQLELLARLRTDEGYMARIEQDGDQWLLIEDHCPICSAAQACQGVCQMELELFQALLAPASVTRTQHILDHQPRCCYRISSGS